ncbi:dihydrodipicolinate synthase family protein [Frigidibacter sp. ROC022]|uniref:dihydrodipicolinate synthase family protein n=1 Tax=Frigidibacter sp. ROC022 TaxID=2971796 RepID=UPI00215A71CB|nr:dihydrodipicolinate synthase family protein [Frigidibacter sp. ROC022]MCR8723164.1 dihydrodipicolinate synthase family protein [Frigidibacter sp. ROC022]
MPRNAQDLPDDIRALIRQGVAIPAHPLALNAERRLDERRQKALSRYYIDAGSGGLAVGVHTTQFAIRDVGLYEPVLRLAAAEMDGWTDRPLVRIAGLVGKTEQARREAALARDLGYHAGLLSLAAWRGTSEAEILDHCRAVAGEIPLVGFYLQDSVGGLRLSAEFWQGFAEIENVVAIKIAPFNRYRTLDVIRGVLAARAEDRVTLYTGNDDHIVADLITPFTLMRDGEPVTVRIKGGLLGHWSVWTQRAVQLLKRCHAAAESGEVPADLMALDAQVTDCNAAVFDVANNFAGCIAGCHEVLRRQGLLEGIWCLDPDETLGPGQAAELDRVSAAYPNLADDAFVAANLDRWLG